MSTAWNSTPGLSSSSARWRRPLASLTKRVRPSYSTRHTSPSRRSAAVAPPGPPERRRRGSAAAGSAPRAPSVASTRSSRSPMHRHAERARALAGARRAARACGVGVARAVAPGEDARLVEVEQRERRPERQPLGRLARRGHVGARDVPVAARRGAQREVARDRAAEDALGRDDVALRERLEQPLDLTRARSPSPRPSQSSASSAIATIQTLSRGKSAKPRAARCSSSRRASPSRPSSR